MAIKIAGSTIIDDSRNIVSAGIVTATTFSGNLTGNVTGNADTATTATSATSATTATTATNAQGLTGSPSILVSSVGVNTSSSPTDLYVSGTSASNIVALGTTDANTTLDFSSGNDFSLTLGGSIVLTNPTGTTVGQSGVIYIQQDGSGSRTCGFGSHWDFPSATAPTLSTGANALDVLTYSVRTSTSIVAAALIGIGTI